MGKACGYLDCQLSRRHAGPHAIETAAVEAYVARAVRESAGSPTKARAESPPPSREDARAAFRAAQARRDAVLRRAFPTRERGR